MWTRAELKDNAKKYFKFNYWKMVLVALVMTMVGGGGGTSFGVSTYNNSDAAPSGYSTISPSELTAIIVGVIIVVLVIMVIGIALSAFLFNPLRVGAQRFFVVSHYQKAELGELGYAFSNSYLNVVKTMFLMQLYVSLWSLLLVIPGVIKSYEYRMIPYILAENPGISSREAFAISKQMMDGNKWNAFVLDLSFFGWIILSTFTCGILAVFYVNPYIFMTDAELYVALKEITFGNHNNGYQTNQGFWDNQCYQNGQGAQPNQNYQGYQDVQGYQGAQGYQPDYNYQGGQGYQPNQNYQGSSGYQPNQGYQGAPGYQPNQGYQGTQGYQPNQDYQGSRGYQDMQGYQPNQNDQEVQWQDHQNAQEQENQEK